MLGQREQLSEQGKSILSHMGSSLDRASGLINDVLDLARGSLGGGFVVDRNTNAPLSPVLDQIVAEMRAIVPDRQIVTRIAVEEPVYCDRDRLAQVASNLLSNAVTHGAADQPIRFEARTDASQFMLSVVNGGEPIPDNVREHLFQPFFRGEARQSRNGLGLGLFIAWEIAKAHDGTLEATSTVEETRFTLKIPRSKS